GGARRDPGRAVAHPRASELGRTALRHPALLAAQESKRDQERAPSHRFGHGTADGGGSRSTTRERVFVVEVRMIRISHDSTRETSLVACETSGNPGAVSRPSAKPNGGGARRRLGESYGQAGRASTTVSRARHRAPPHRAARRGRDHAWSIGP